MSIILRALKKIQNQGAEQAPPPEEQPQESFGRASLSDDFAFGPAPEEALSPASSPSAGELVKSSKITRVLLLIITVLGLLSATWFASEIYKNYKSSKLAGAPPQVARVEVKPAPVSATPQQASLQKAAPTAVPAPQAVVSPQTAPTAQETPVQEQPVQVAAEPHVQAQPPVPVTPTREGGRLFEAPRQELSASAQESAIKEPAALSMASLAAQPPAHVAESLEKEVEPQPLQRPDLKINAIAWRALEPKAIVNMQRVYVGDMIEGAKVKEIRRKSVVFEFAGEEFEIRF